MMTPNLLSDLQTEQTDKIQTPELLKHSARKCTLIIGEAKKTFLLQPTTRKRNTRKDEWNITFSMTCVVTVGGNVTEIEAKMKHFLVMNQLVQLFIPFCLGQTRGRRGEAEAGHEVHG